MSVVTSLTQAGVESGVLTSNQIQLTQSGLETNVTTSTKTQLTQAGIEVDVLTSNILMLSQIGVEVAISYRLPVGTVVPPAGVTVDPLAPVGCCLGTYQEGQRCLTTYSGSVVSTTVFVKRPCP